MGSYSTYLPNNYFKFENRIFENIPKHSSISFTSIIFTIEKVENFNNS
jgi:hypothetical protein